MLSSHTYQGLFAEWELRYAREIIKRFQREFPVLRRDDIDDLMQECLTHWYFRRHRYDASRQCSCQNFMHKVITNKIRHILEAQERNKRKALYKSLPIEMFLIDEDDDLSGCLAVNDEDFEKSSYDDLCRLLARAMEKLSIRQQKLCRLIKDKGLNISEISERLKIPRATLFDEILRIREVFRKEGLRDYL